MDKVDLPLFSVIIPSYNRRADLAALLPALANQTLPKNQYEVILVDDGSTDGTDDFVDAFRERSPMRFRFFKQDHRGAGAARNYGMREASGQVFIFIDSDCIAPPDWLAEIRKAFDRDPSIDAFGGRDDARGDFSPLQKAINYAMTSFLTTGGLRGGRKKRLAKFYPRSFNMGVRREIIPKTGGFGHFKRAHDIELSHRIIQSGAKVVYLPEAVVFHKRRTSLKTFFIQIFNWGFARINLYKMHSKMLEPLHFAPAIGLWISLIFTGFAFLYGPLFVYWKIVAGFVGIILVGMSLNAAVRWKSLLTGLLVPLVIGLQVSAYGLGFTFAFIWRILLGRQNLLDRGAQSPTQT